MAADRLLDPADPRLDPFRDLRGQARAGGPTVVVEGEDAVRRLLASGRPVTAVAASPSRAERLRPAVPPQVPLLEVEEDVLSRAAGLELHRGCLAAAPRPRVGPPDWAGWAGRPRLRAVLAEGLADPANLGALVRNCRAFGADVLLLAGGADPFAPRAVRAAMGHCFGLPLGAAPDPVATVAAARAAIPDLQVLAATPAPDAEPLPGVRPPGRLLLLIGAEGPGLSAPLLALADRRVRIPIDPSVDSLNAAAAAAVFLYALTAEPR